LIHQVLVDRRVVAAQPQWLSMKSRWGSHSDAGPMVGAGGRVEETPVATPGEFASGPVAGAE
jgi:hypothetical protein